MLRLQPEWFRSDCQSGSAVVIGLLPDPVSMPLVEEIAHSLKFLNRFSSFKFHQLATVPRFNPADPEVGDEKPHHVAVTKVRHKGSSVTIPAIAAGVAGGCDSKVLQAVRQGLEAQTRSWITER